MLCRAKEVCACSFVCTRARVCAYVIGLVGTVVGACGLGVEW